MLSPEAFLTSTLRAHPSGQAVTRILSAAIQAVEPGQAVQRFVQCQGQRLVVDGQVYALDQIGRILLLGVGKATEAMFRPLAGLSAAEASTRGLLIPKGAFPPPWDGCEIQPGGHPVPDENSLQAGTKALELVRGLSADDLLLCLISGGGSALMTAPQPRLTLDDLRSLTSALLACGARIDEINTLRRHLDRLKGGGLAQAAAPARVISLILSDVVGNPLEAIASGPTAPDPTTRADALAVLEKYGLTAKISPAILQTLKTAPETPKPGEALFERVQNVLVGSNSLAAQASLEQARAEGFRTVFLGETWQGEAREVAKTFCERLKTDSKISRFSKLQRRETLESRFPLCLIAGGETTVTLRQSSGQAIKGSGRGGRNQELALAAVNELAGLKNVLLVSLATDGEDGPTNAAGAVVTGETQKRALSLGLDSDAFLRENNAYPFFDALGDLLKPGPTGTNVNDLTFLFAF